MFTDLGNWVSSMFDGIFDSEDEDGSSAGTDDDFFNDEF